MTATPLTVHNAEIRTATVEIKTLTVSGKQVTLAVFRQLIQDHLIDQDGGLRGTPWGVVNYHPDKCGDHPYHLHVAWQNGSDLRRDRIDPPRQAALHGRTAALAFIAAIRAGLREPNRGTAVDGHGLVGVKCSLDLHPHTGMSNSATRQVRFIHDGVSYSTAVKVEVGKAFQGEPAALAWLEESAASTVPPLDEALSLLPSAQYRRLWSEISALPQLFIAV
jgi:hypothetical protein